MTPPKVAIVVLNWRDSEATFACLDSLAATDYPNFRAVVVDNASIDGSVDELARRPSIDLVRNSVNLGFTGGVNVGLRHAADSGADYIWVLNSDAVVRPDVLGKLVAVAEADPTIGLVSPVFHDPDEPERVEFCVGRFDPLARYASQTADPAQARDWQRNFPDEILLLGTALLVRRAVFERIGGLDDQFFAYVEDVDFSLRSLRAGFRNVAVPDAVVFHKFKQPADNPESCPPYLHYFMSRNYLLLWHKLPGSLFCKATLWFLRQRLIQLQRLKDDRAGTDALLAGLWDGLRRIGGPYVAQRRMPWPLDALFRRCAGAILVLLDGGRANKT